MPSSVCATGASSINRRLARRSSWRQGRLEAGAPPTVQPPELGFSGGHGGWNCLALSVEHCHDKVLFDVLRPDLFTPALNEDWPWPEWGPGGVCRMALAEQSPGCCCTRPLPALAGQWWILTLASPTPHRPTCPALQTDLLQHPLCLVHLDGVTTRQARALDPWREMLLLAGRLQQVFERVCQGATGIKQAPPPDPVTVSTKDLA